MTHTTKTTLRTTILIGLAAATLIGPAQARGFGGFHSGFGGRGIAVGERYPGWHDHGGFGHGWGHRGFGWGIGTIGFGSYGFCYTKRFIDPFGNIVLRRVCE